MRIENHFRPPQSEKVGIEQAQNAKVRIVAKDVFASFPTIGMDPFTLGGLCALGGAAIMWIGGKIVGTAVDVAGTAVGTDIANYLYPTSETNPFNMKECRESYRYGSRPDVRAGKLRPNPIFKSSIAGVFDSFRSALENAVNHQGILPSAIISGPYGTGKTTACEGIARGGNWNYFLLTGEQFSKLLQNEEVSNRFFRDIRKEKCPTVFVIDEADSLFKTEDETSEKVFEQFRSQTSSRDQKLMFLFVTKIDLKMISDQAFLSRMNYQINIEMPGQEELEKIIHQQANFLFKAPFSWSFTEDACRHLAMTVFKGRNGRDVQSALMSLNPNHLSMDKNQLYKHIKVYFDEHRI